MKTAVIMSIGTYYSPWFPYTVASTYGLCDFMVVVNAGFDLKNLDPKEYEVPLEQVSRDIDELDVERKVIEVSDYSRLRHRYPVVTQKMANQLKLARWYDHRGRGITLAGDIAFDEGADMILRMDTDTVCYRDILGLRDRTDTLSIYQHEFCGDLHHLADPGPDSPYNDAPYYYAPHKDDWCIGAGSPMIHAHRTPSPDHHCAHLRWVNPAELSQEAKFQHFRDRAVIRLWTNEFGAFTDELFSRAEAEAVTISKMKRKPTEIPPPEACRYSRRNLHEYLEET